MKKIALVALLIATGVFYSDAAIIISPEATQNGGAATLTITEDITFDITANGTFNALVIDELTSTAALGAEIYSAVESIAVSLNGYDTSFDRTLTLNVPLGYSSNDITPYDGLLYLNDSRTALDAGDTLVIKAQSFSFTGSSFLSPEIVGTHNGNVFIVGDSFDTISSVETIPEPATLGLFGLFGGGIFAVRRIFMI